MVQMFQRTIGQAVGEPWCMSFVQYCLTWPDYFIGGEKSQVFASEHCLSVWMKTPINHRINTPFPGCIAVWQYGDTSSGHTGLVESYGVDGKRPYIISIEGNTSDSERIVREGDGVFMKKRFLSYTKKMRLRGFLNPWPMGD